MIKKNKLTLAIIAALSSTALISTSAFAAEKTERQEIEVIKVTGLASSLARALQTKQFADSIQDSIVAEDMGKMPDQNVAESLQRITGVTISRSNGEGSKLTIRGFGPQFNVVKMNNRTLATTGTSRDFDFQVLPAELISGADVIKSPTANLDAGSIGGFVNLHSARPFDNVGFHAAGSVKAKYQDLAGEVTPEFSGIISNTFANDTIGVLAGFSYKETESRIDTYKGNLWGAYSEYNLTDPEEKGYGFPLAKEQVLGEDGQPTTLEGSRGPGRARYIMNNENRKRIGGNLSVQWAHNDNMISTFDALYSQLDRDQLGTGIQVAMQTNEYTAASVTDSGTIRTATLKNTDLEFMLTNGMNESTTEAYGYNFVYTGDRLTLSADLSYSTAKESFKGDNNTVMHWTRFNADGTDHASTTTLDFSQGDIPALSYTGMDLNDPSTVLASWQDYSGSEAQDTVTEVRLDAKYEIEIGVITSIETGVSYSNRELATTPLHMINDPTTGAADWSHPAMWMGSGSTGSGWHSDINAGAIDTSIFVPGEGNYMEGVSGDFPRQWLSVSSYQAYVDASQDYLDTLDDVKDHPKVVAGWNTLYEGTAGAVNTDETSTSLYLQVNLEGEIGDYYWRGNVGGRYIKTDTDASGTSTTIDRLSLKAGGAIPSQNAPVLTTEYTTFSSSDDYFLPSINLTLELSDENYVRFGSAKTITRPNMRDKSANFTESSWSGNVVYIGGGDPNLKPYEVTQFDLSYEHYGEHTSYSAGFYYKDITSFISVFTTTGPFDVPVDQDLQDAWDSEGYSGGVSYSSSRPTNRTGGTVKGVELAFMHTFDYMSGFWSGFGVQANITLADSEDEDTVSVVRPGVPEPSSGLEGFADTSYNVVGFYDKDGVQVRLAYNYRDEFLESRYDGDGPRYNVAYGQLDLSTSYDINENIKIMFEATNLTDETIVKYHGIRERVGLVELSGVRYNLGVHATF
ncbi:TonB-dependent receptor [Colwellia piezophila]|uniref:TonB-dependent receptor n=1 Tax=Colwellia piezophila TaxID=211668 RepID=UPI00035E3A80|nr:TonB-dependent receptor [Colwellia piezophila]